MDRSDRPAQQGGLLHLTAPGRARARLARGAIVGSRVPQVSGNALGGRDHTSMTANGERRVTQDYD
jgi:hypothetical protein